MGMGHKDLESTSGKGKQMSINIGIPGVLWDEPLDAMQ